MPSFVDRFVQDLQTLTVLPSPPPVMARLIATLERPNVPLAEVAEQARADPALAAQMLRIANSAAYPARVPVSSVQDALLRLGLKEVRRLSLVLGVYNSLHAGRSPIDRDAFWRHSLSVAHAAEIFARRATVRVAPTDQPPDPETMFLAGLFHDLGLLVLATYYPNDYATVRLAADQTSEPLWMIEKSELDVDHGELGALLIAQWRLPEPVAAAVRAHHQADRGAETASPDDLRSARLLRIAEAVCHAADIGDLEEERLSDDDAEDAGDLRLGADTIAEIVKETRAEAQRAGLKLAAARR